ncbi:MAG TPA: EAL domain-containing protein [Bryobacteraceae bacterium]|nr:EAL domain-containing protein [Bryobacteraceae bacterium]
MNETTPVELPRTAKAPRGGRTDSLASLQKLSTLPALPKAELVSTFVRQGLDLLGCRVGSFSEQSSHVVGSQVFRRESDVPIRDVDPRSAQVLLTRALVVGPEGYLGVPVSIADENLGVLSYWGFDSGCPYDIEERVAVLHLLASLLAARLALLRLTEKIAYQARHDALTGLPNRLFLQEMLEQALTSARRDRTGLAVVFIDLDRFKQVNDTLGHSTGDVLLQQVAWRLSRRLDKHNNLARMGGDEFTAILTGFRDEFEAIQVVQNLLEEVRKPTEVYGYELFVTASMGVSFFPKDGKDANVLLQNADSAMYMAKSQGRDGFCLYSTSRSEAALESFELENYLRRAIENEELELLYQPQVNRSKELTGFEVLLLWQHPKLGKISPVQFIPIAEESGMIVPIGLWVLERALRQLAQWSREGLKSVRLAVNVSALQFQQADFVEKVAEALAQYDVDPARLELEMTESVLMKDVDSTAIRLLALRELGIRITIDDFGTGYSSLSYLRQIPADGLKIDRSFFREDRQGSNRLEMIRTIVTLAHSMGLRVTAEGIEDDEQVELAREAGCDEMQGHCFGIAARPEVASRQLKRATPDPV